MRTSVPRCAVLAVALLASPLAHACEPVVAPCVGPVVVVPAYTPEGLRIGTLEARIRPVLRLERSHFTGQPLTVIYNNPGRLPGAIDPTLELMPLLPGRHLSSRAVYPTGY